MPALAAPVRVVVVVLRMGLVIVDVALGIVVPFEKFTLPAQDLADDVVLRLCQDAVNVHHFPSGEDHFVQLLAGQSAQIDLGLHSGFGQFGAHRVHLSIPTISSAEDAKLSRHLRAVLAQNAVNARK